MLWDSDLRALLPQLLLDRGSGSHRQAPDVCNSPQGVALEALKSLEPEERKDFITTLRSASARLHQPRSPER